MADFQIKINNLIIYELDKMERFAWGDYSVAIQQFSRFIRRVVWTEDNALLLSAVLRTLNMVYSLFCKEIPFAEYELVGIYVKQFKKVWVNYQPIHPTIEQWNDIEQKADQLLTGIIIKKQWNILNPYIDTNDSENFGEGLLSIFDDMFRHSIVNNEGVYTRDYKSINHMYRGTKGNRDYTWLLPNPDYAGLNRWNPKGRCFLYAAIEDDKNIFDINNGVYHGEMVCLEELRTEIGEEVTLCELQFKPGIPNKKVFDFSYNDTSLLDMETYTKEELQLLTQEIIEDVRIILNGNQIKNNKSLINAITREIESRHEDTLSLVGRFAAKTLVKMICDNIFVPLDKLEDTDPKKREICYGSFHVLANYIESKGYSGIIYPSTRAALIKQTGKNIVLFDYKDITHKPKSLKVITHKRYL